MKKIIDIWFNDISKFNNENIIIGLASNKCDLYGKETINEVRSFCNKNNIFLELTSV